jgi:membrane-associated phospholipid phosphatase
MQAPTLFIAIFIAGFVIAIIFMAINFRWKISIHTAFASASITVFIIVYGSIGALTALLLPPVAWSRIEMKLHSPTQAIGGALLSAIITIIVFQFFGLINAQA